MSALNDLGYQQDDLLVKVSELLVATADESDEMVDASISEVLRLLRDRLSMDVVFVSEFENGQQVFHQVVTPDNRPVLRAGEANPLESTWCKRVVDGRLPKFIADTSQNPETVELLKGVPHPVGTFISTPILLSNGNVYGTLCTFSFHPVDQPNPNDLKRLEYTAKLAAGKLEKRRGMRASPAAAPEWDLKPMDPPLLRR